MGAIVFDLLMLEKYINPNLKVLKTKISLMCRKYLGDFSANNMKKSGLNGCVYDFSVDYRAFYSSDIINIHKNLIKKHNLK